MIFRTVSGHRTDLVLHLRFDSHCCGLIWWFGSGKFAAFPSRSLMVDGIFSRQTKLAQDCRRPCGWSGRADRLHSRGHVGSIPITGCLQLQAPGFRWMLARRLRAIRLANPFRSMGGLGRKTESFTGGNGALESISTRFGGWVAEQQPGWIGTVAGIRSADNTYYVKLHMDLPRKRLLRRFGWNRYRSMS